MRRIIEDAVLNDTFRMRARWCARIGFVPPSVRYIACSHLWAGTWLELINVP